GHPHPVHPTQLYESLGLFVIYLLFCYVYPRRTRQGGLLLLYPVFYGVLRFLVEFFRADPTHEVPLVHLRLSQAISLGLVIAGLLVYITVRSRLPERGAEEAPPRA
ncbi:MAG TPA: prolipoprotein diacylglyceryl transferase, partial [Candidatus Hydrogenedentes bacterium]|nr:prolipoprotein diacylglyceryl transferase [Candidatus Hydrogenedentota bacterium]